MRTFFHTMQKDQTQSCTIFDALTRWEFFSAKLDNSALPVVYYKMVLYIGYFKRYGEIYMKKLLCIDGNSILNRAFYGIRILTNKDGFPTNALYGLVNIISREIERIKPDYAAIAYDLKAPTFRHKMYDEYKAGRHAMPEELVLQMPESRELARALGLHVLSLEGYEADDILGTLSAMAEADPEGCEAYVLTGDRDSLQLISDKTRVLLTGNSETAVMDTDAFIAKYGVRPDQFVDVKALMGDTSDHIPGVPGIGEKTAIKLISELSSLDGVYEKLSVANMTPSVRKKLTEGRDSAYLSQTLARICREVPLGITLDELTFDGMDKTLAKTLFTKYEFFGFIKRFELANVEAAAPDITAKEGISEPSSAEAPAILPEAIDESSLPSLPGGRYAMSYESGGRLVLCNGEHLYTCAVHDKVAAQAFLDDQARQFICYDCKTLYHTMDREGLHFRRCDFDVMLAAYVVNAGWGKYELDRLSLTYLGEGVAEGGEIAAYTSRLYDVLSAELERTEQTSVFYDIEMPLAAVLCDMEQLGFMIRRDAIAAYGEVLDAVASELETRIYAYAGKSFNINSPKQLGEVLFETLMLPTDKKTKTGYSTGAEVLEKLKRYHPIIEDILEYRQVTKLKGTYVDGLLKLADSEGRIHTTFKQTGTATGRLSSAEPNLQNIPIRTEMGRELRKFFVPTSSDRVLIDADYSQIELRLLCHIAGDNAMREAFLRGFDIHTDTASRVFGVDKDLVSIELRKKAKAINFGIMYGMGEHSLSEDLHISRAEAKSYIESYLHSYPDIDRYLKNVISSAYENGYVTTIAGRRRLIPELAESNKMRKKFGERIAMNSPIQGTAADIIKIAMIRVHRRLAESGLDARMILQVHDELIVEAHKDCADEALAILREEMENAVSLSVPLDVEAHIGTSWFEAH